MTSAESKNTAALEEEAVEEDKNQYSMVEKKCIHFTNPDITQQIFFTLTQYQIVVSGKALLDNLFLPYPIIL